MTPDRALLIFDVVARTKSYRQLCKSHLYPRILWCDPVYRSATANRWYIEAQRIANYLNYREIPLLVRLGVLQQYNIHKPVCAIITELGDEYKNWHNEPISTLYDDIRFALYNHRPSRLR